MTEATEPPPLVPGAHRRIRMLEAHDGAFTGELVADGDAVRVRASADVLRGDPSWGFSGADHVASPLDLVRRADGLDVLLPWCTERVEVFLGRRDAAEVTLTTGERVTLVGSLLRGLVELSGSAATGSWWLTDGGRPVFAFGAGRSAVAGAVEIIGRLRTGTADRGLDRVLADIESGLEEPRTLIRRTEKWESDLTELAAPQPLRCDVFPPTVAGEVMRRRSSASLPESEGSRPSWSGRLGTAASEFLTAVRGLLGHVMPFARRAGHSVAVRTGAKRGRRESADRGRTARRRRLMIGLSAAAVVLLAGLLWPTGDADGPASAQPSAGPESNPRVKTPPVRTGGPTPTAASAAKTEEASSAAGNPIDAAPALLQGLQRCLGDGDEVCAEAIVEGSSSAVLTAITEPNAGDEVFLVDSYGDIAVIRRDGGDRGQQILVFLRQKDGWLVRDVYDVANQPGSS